MKACWMPSTDGPMPTFSPSERHPLTSAPRLGLCERASAAARWLDQFLARPVSSPSLDRGATRWAARARLVRAGRPGQRRPEATRMSTARRGVGAPRSGGGPEGPGSGAGGDAHQLSSVALLAGPDDEGPRHVPEGLPPVRASGTLGVGGRLDDRVDPVAGAHQAHVQVRDRVVVVGEGDPAPLVVDGRAIEV